MPLPPDAPCPCQSRHPYADCCAPFHHGSRTPPHAEALMRSRYSAYVLRLIDYLVASTVPAQQALLDTGACTDGAAPPAGSG